MSIIEFGLIVVCCGGATVSYFHPEYFENHLSHPNEWWDGIVRFFS